MDQPRGIRLNNPTNIRKNSIQWRGSSVEQNDPAFVRFISPVWGLRAAGLIFSLYETKYGLKTIRAYINRFAPSTENDTDAYVNHVCSLCKAQPDEPYPLSVEEKLISLLKAVVRHENGKPDDVTPFFWYTDNIYSGAAAMVLSEMKQRENKK